MMNTHAMLLMLLCAFLGQSGALAKSQLGCNVPLTSYRDTIVKDAAGKSSCMIRVERAFAACGATAVGILPYHTFMFKRTIHGGKSVAYMTDLRYSVARGGAGKGKGDLLLLTPTPAHIADFQRGMTECMLYAAKIGFHTIVITPHMNAPKLTLWRNLLAFQPYEEYNGITYEAAMIAPLVAASKAAIAAGAQVRLALQGEMNMAIAMYPVEWGKLLAETKAALGPSAKVGVSMNWNKVCGEFCRFYPATLFAQKEAYKTLMQSVDFIGVSSYPNVLASYTINPNQMDFDASLKQLDKEMVEFIGFGPAILASTKKTELQWSEFGVGGGCDSTASCSAKSLAIIARYTYAMVAGPYGLYRDPWKPKWASDFRFAFHQQALRKLNSDDGPFPVSFALLWSNGSMDVCGVDPDSTTKKGTFYSSQICSMIHDYNANGVVP